MKEIKIIKHEEISAIKIVILSGDTETATLEIYPNDVGDKFREIVLAQLQKHTPIVFNVSPADYLLDLENLESIALQQEAAVEELRTKNEEQETRIEMLERQLEEAKASNEDWARRLKEAQGGKIEVMEEEKPS